MRPSLALVACVSLIFVAICASEVSADSLSVVPLPEILTDPNEGNTYGFLPVLLLLDPRGRIHNIIANDLRWNRITGWFPGLRLYGYPSTTSRYFVTLRKSEKIDQDYTLEYQDERLFDSTAQLAATLEFHEDSRSRFFGIGNDTSRATETNYTDSGGGLRLDLGYPIGRGWMVRWKPRLQRVSVRRGGVEGLPFTAEVSPSLPGVDGSTIHGEGFALQFDDRDSISIPTRGTFGLGYVEGVDRSLGSTTSYVKYGLGVRHFQPIASRLVLAVRADLDYIAGADRAPFYERNTLGGQKSLRGFGRNRFTDADRFLAAVELRAIVLRLAPFGVELEIETAPFVDIGRVFSSAASFPVSDLKPVGGIGFRGLVRPDVVGFVDLGVGSEGTVAFTGLGYPF